jgi:hypothetical protein
MRRRQCLAIDLQDDAAAIAEYDRIHAPGGPWPEVIAEIDPAVQARQPDPGTQEVPDPLARAPARSGSSWRACST